MQYPLKVGRQRKGGGWCNPAILIRPNYFFERKKRKKKQLCSMVFNLTVNQYTFPDNLNMLSKSCYYYYYFFKFRFIELAKSSILTQVSLKIGKGNICNCVVIVTWNTESLYSFAMLLWMDCSYQGTTYSYIRCLFSYCNELQWPLPTCFKVL